MRKMFFCGNKSGNKEEIERDYLYFKEGEDMNLKSTTNVIRSAEILPVIHLKVTRGNGTQSDLARTVHIFYLENGTYIGEIDPATDAERVITS